MATDGTKRASLAIDNVRAVVVLLVLAFHSVLAYLSFLPPHPGVFAAPPFLWRSFPVVDTARWFGFDIFCAWLDVFLMSFFFLVSGLFAWPSIARKGARRFVADRLVRLGLPFAVVVGFLMPLAHYPVYLQTASDPGIAGFVQAWLRLPLWPAGPMWFLWLLLVGDIAAAGLFQAMGRHRGLMLRLSHQAGDHPGRFLAGLLAAALVAYVPLALMFGPFAWTQFGPFSLQLSRPLHYALYFFAGVALGAAGIGRGPFAPDASLARCWQAWVAAAIVTVGLWLGLQALAMPKAGVAATGWPPLLASLGFALAVFTNCFAGLALAVRFGAVRRPMLASLRANAYGIYLIHYGFVVWLQYALLPAVWPAVIKAAAVFAGTLAASWSAAAALRRIPAVARVVGGGHRAAPRHPARPTTAPSVGALS